MPFKIYIKDHLANNINRYKDVGKIIEVSSMTVNNGFITIGSYHLPIANILFVEEF